MIDLDHNATTRPSPAVVQAVTAALTELWHNPSSVHRAGQEARHAVELARKEAAALIGVSAREIVFTSGGTEAIDLAIRGVLGAARPDRLDPRHAHDESSRHGLDPAIRPEGVAHPGVTRAAPVIVSTRVEHASVRDLLGALEEARCAEVRWAPVDREGIVDLEALGSLLDGASLCVLQWANNETGAVQPVEAVGALCRQRRVPFLCDGTQWVGKEPVAPAPGVGLPCDLLAFAPHKFHGPKGVGVLRVRRGLGLEPTLHGTQELGRRGGTENVPGIVGAGVACREARQWLTRPDERHRLAGLRDRFEAAVLAGVPDAVVNGPRDPARRLWNTTSIGFPRVEAEALLLMLSERGVNASAGAACSSGSLDPSPVLLAMGVDRDVAHGSLRFSLSKDTTAAELDEAARVVIECVTQLRSSLAAAG